MAGSLIPNNTAADFLQGAALGASHCISYPKPVCLVSKLLPLFAFITEDAGLGVAEILQY